MIAGLRLDTGYRDAYTKKWGGAPGSGPRWGKPREPERLHRPPPRRLLAASGALDLAPPQHLGSALTQQRQGGLQ